MAQIRIDNIAKKIEIDGVSHSVAMGDFPIDIALVKFNMATRTGSIYYQNAPNQPVAIGASRFMAFGKFVNRWHAMQSPVVLSPDEIKSAAIDQINATREKALAGGLSWNGKIWHTDMVFQAQITAYVSAYGTGLLAPTSTVTIRAKDNTTNVLNRAQLFALAGALMTFVGQTFEASWAAKDAL